MSQQTINLGTTDNDGTGTTLKAGGEMINDNFTELYGIWIALSGSYASATTFTFTGTDKDAKLIQLSLLTLTDSAGTTRRIGYVKSAVNSSGTITATAGTIGGFSIGATTLTATNLTLDSANQKITLGSGNDVVILDAADGTYRLAIGNATYASAPFRSLCKPQHGHHLRVKQHYPSHWLESLEEKI